jgi:hypothetical protein
MSLSEFEGRLVVGRLSLGLVPDYRAFSELHRINTQHQVQLGIEINPHRLGTAPGFCELSRRFNIGIQGVHGPIAGVPQDFFRNFKYDIRNDRTEVIKSLIWWVGFGAQSEPSYTRAFGDHVQLSQQLKSYLVMHHEPLEIMGESVVKAAAKELNGRIYRENGWGPEDFRPDPLSWDIVRIRDYVQEMGIRSLLDTATAARTGAVNGYSILQAFDVLDPAAIHFSEYDSGTHQENQIPTSSSANAGELRDLVRRIKHTDVVLVLEVRPSPSAETSIMQTLEFIDSC